MKWINSSLKQKKSIINISADLNVDSQRIDKMFESEVTLELQEWHLKGGNSDPKYDNV